MNEWLEKYNKYTKYKRDTMAFLIAPLTQEQISFYHSKDEIAQASSSNSLKELKQWLISQLNKDGYNSTILSSTFNKMAQKSNIPLKIVKYFLATLFNVVLVANAVRYYKKIVDEDVSIIEKKIYLVNNKNSRQKYFYRKDRILWIMGEWMYHLEVFNDFYISHQNILTEYDISPTSFSVVPQKRKVLYKTI